LFLQLAWLGGCASWATRDSARLSTASPPGWQNHRAAMLAISGWHIKGKIGYRSDADAGSAWLDWRQHQEQFDLHLGGPFGAGTVQLVGDERSAILRQADEPEISAHSAADLSVKVLGWRLPVDALVYWIRGIPAPQQSHTEAHYTPDGALNRFEQSGWQLKLSRYRDTSAGRLPGKIIATRDSVRFTLLIQDIQLPI